MNMNLELDEGLLNLSQDHGNDHAQPSLNINLDSLDEELKEAVLQGTQLEKLIEDAFNKRDALFEETNTLRTQLKFITSEIEKANKEYEQLINVSTAEKTELENKFNELKTKDMKSMTPISKFTRIKESIVPNPRRKVWKCVKIIVPVALFLAVCKFTSLGSFCLAKIIEWFGQYVQLTWSKAI